jgi:hypothetical protein
MAKIRSISARIVTSNQPGAGTDSYIYLGIGGREFSCDSSDSTNDFEQGLDQTFVFGDKATVDEAEYNDPRMPQLTTDDLDYPVYVRMEESGAGPSWCVERVTVTVADDEDKKTVFDNRSLSGAGRIWLGSTYGLKIGLKKAA